MKQLVLLFTMLACAVQPAQAQGTVQFKAILTGASEVPPNNDPTIGTGTFWLDGNLLSFLVNVPSDNFIPQSAYIHGPALLGPNGPILFDLGGPVFHSGSSQGDPPFASFFSPAAPPLGAGPFPLTAAQINELESGLWYVNITSAMLPDGQLRGQILAVPERALLSCVAYTNNQFRFAITGVTGYSCIIQASTNLESWVSLETNTCPYTFTDTSATNYPYRFYRAIH